MLGQGQNLSQRSLGLFNAAAVLATKVLDKLIGLVGPGGMAFNCEMLSPASARFRSLRGSGQGAEGVSLLA